MALTKRCAVCGRIYNYNERHSCAAGAISEPAIGTGSPSNPGVEEAADPILGAVLGDRYLMLARLSRGGMGVVYKARHVLLDTPVAVKILLEPQDQVAQLRFLQEAKLASQIRHPNTVYISDFGVLDDGRSYLVMELLHGPTLGKVLRAGPMPALRACRIAAQIATGLQAVHDRGIVHRDLKPDNVFLVEQDGDKDHVKIVDFGIALKARAAAARAAGSMPGVSAMMNLGPAPAGGARDNSRYTLAGTVMGTPHYMSPEQIEGEDLDARSDEYALGCILYELLTGTVPFDAAEPSAVLLRHLASDVQPLRERYPQGRAPASLEAVVMRMLAKQRSERFPTMRDAAEALRQEAEKLTGRQSSQVILPQGARSGLVIHGRRFSLWAALPVAALLLGGGIYLGVRDYRRSERGESLRPDELRAVRQQALELLTRGVHDPDEEVRRSVVEGLGLARDPRQLQLVLPLVGDPSAAVAAQAAIALGLLGDGAAAAPLLAAARDNPAANVRMAAAAAAWQLGKGQGRELLLHALDGSDAGAQQRAAFLLAEQGEPRAQALLRQLLTSPQLPEESAVQLLGRLAQSGDAEARARLRERLADPGRPAFLLAAARLVQLGDEVAVQALRARATAALPAQQLLASRLLVTADPEHSLPLLRRVAQDPNADLPARLVALSGLGQAGGLGEMRILRPLLAKEQPPALQRGAAVAVLQIFARDPGALSEQGLLWAHAALSDSDWVVRESAAVVLGELPGSEAAALLSKLSADREPQVRRSALRALGRREQSFTAAAPQDEAVLAALRVGLGDTDQSVRLEALRALAKVAQTLVQRGAVGLGSRLTGWLGGILTEGSALEQVLARAALLGAGDSGQKAKLRELLHSPSPEARRAALESLEAEPELLASMLADPASGVRLLAARRLAELGDRRAVPVLKEALSQGGAAARTAQALLIRLGEKLAPPAASGQDSVEQRLQAVEALASLPVEQALAQLLLMARDHDPAVRRQVAVVAADLPGGGLAVLRLLLEDNNASVRAQAAALLGRLQPSRLPAPAPTAPVTASPADASPARPAPAAAAALAAPVGPEPPVESPAETTSTPAPASPKSLEAQAAALTQSAVKLVQQRDFNRARQLFEKARQLCGREKKSAGCGALLFDLSYQLARLYEAQGYEAEAMGEYERLIKQAGRVPGKAAELSAAQAGVIRLAPRLGVVMITRSSGGKCQEVTKWMPLGVHTIDVGGQKQEVTVRADAPVRVGACQ
jgi:serine/threonine protein kinase/HEAT repeat protein